MSNENGSSHRWCFKRIVVRCLPALLISGVVLTALPAAAQIIDPGGDIYAMVSDPVRNVFYATVSTGHLVRVNFGATAIDHQVALPGSTTSRYMTIAPDGSRLFLADYGDSQIFVYSLPGMVHEATYDLPHPDPGTVTKYRGLGATNIRLYAVSYDDTLAIVDTTTGVTLFNNVPQIDEFSLAYPEIVVRPDGTSIIVWPYIYDVAYDVPGLIGQECCASEDPAYDMDVSPGGEYIYAVSYSLRVLDNPPSGLPRLMHHALLPGSGLRGSAVAVAADGNTVYVGSNTTAQFTAVRTSDWLSYHVGTLHGEVQPRQLVLSMDQQYLAAGIRTSTNDDRFEMVSVVDLEVNRGAARVVPFDESFEVPFYDGWTSADWGVGHVVDNVDWALGRGPALAGSYQMTVGGAWWVSTETVDVDIAAGTWTDVGEVILTGHTDWPLPVGMCADPAAEVGKSTLVEIHGHGFHEDVMVTPHFSDIILSSVARSSEHLIQVEVTIDAGAETGKRVDAIRVSNPGEDAVEKYYTELMIIPPGQVAFAFSEQSITIDEGAGSVSAEVVRLGPTDGAVGVDYQTLNYTAVAGQDYSAESETLSWLDGDGAPKSILVPILDDSDVEGNELFEIQLANPTGGALLGVVSTVEVTIDDNDDSELEFASTTSTADENGGTHTLYVTRSGNLSADASANFATTAVSASAGIDYTDTAGVVSWPAGDDSPRPIDVNIIDDGLLEGTESFRVVLSGPSGNASLGQNDEITVYIEDDDQPAFRFTSASYSVAEGGGTVTLMVERLGPTTDAVSVDYASSDLSAEAGSDYAAVSNTLNWAAGDATAKPITVTITPDTSVEGDEAFTVILDNPSSGAVLRDPSTANVTIIDDDCSIHFAASSYIVDEGFTTINVGVLRSGNDTGEVAASYSVGGGTATAGTDFAAVGGDLTWGDGDDSVREITVTVYDDDMVEGGESVILTLSNPVGDAAIGTPGTTTITIADNDLTEFSVNFTPVSQQTRPSVGLDAQGAAVAIWDSYLQDGSGWGVYGTRYDTGGVPLGEFQVANTTIGDQRDAAVAMAPNGAFVVVWESPDALGTGIYMRRYSATGTPLAVEQLVNTNENFEQTTPAVAMDSEGRILVVWESGDANGSGIFAQAYTAAGAKAGGERQLNSTTSGDQLLPAVAALPGVGFVTVWQSYGQDGPANGIVGRRLGTNGAPIDPEWIANTLTSGNQEDPAVAANNNGFVVAWKDATHQDGSGWSIRMQRFSTTAVKVGSETGVNTYGANAQYDPAVAIDGADTAVVAWVSDDQDGSVEGVFMRFMPLEQSPSNEIQLNLYTTGTQDEPALSCNPSGAFFAAWSSGGQDGSGDGVYGARGLTPDVNAIFADDFESGGTFMWSAVVP